MGLRSCRTWSVSASSETFVECVLHVEPKDTIKLKSRGGRMHPAASMEDTGAHPGAASPWPAGLGRHEAKDFQKHELDVLGMV